jgi:hypothetical protein
MKLIQLIGEGWDEMGIQDPGIYDVIEAHDHSISNQSEILRSKQCGCFYCGMIFPPSEVTDWMNENPHPKTGKPREPTAPCPYCNKDTVIGDASGYPINQEFLDKMYEHWFGR